MVCTPFLLQVCCKVCYCKRKTHDIERYTVGFLGADDGNRTHTASLGSWSSTTKLHLHAVWFILASFLRLVNLFSHGP